MRRSSEHYVLCAVAAFAFMGLIAVGALVEPDPRGFGSHEGLGLPACPTRSMFGIRCPGCGVTTACILFVRGDFVASFSTQPFGFVVACVVCLFAISALLAHVRGRSIEVLIERATRRRVVLPLVLFALVAWIVKLA